MSQPSIDSASASGQSNPPSNETQPSSGGGGLHPAHLGATPIPGGARFGVYAHPAQRCVVRLFGDGEPDEHELSPRDDGFFEADVPGVKPGALYKFVVDGKEMPDPCARFLPQGVHGPAMLLADDYRWRSGGGVHRPLHQHVIYELHVGTFTAEGTYEGARERLPELVALGVTAIELMPLAAFPGSRGWGYEGVALFAPFAPYGQPDELRRLIDEAHGHGLAVFLDVVYNHFGPAGNYLPAYSSDYFTSERRNAWGEAPNYAHPALRRMIIDNALYWLRDFRFDGLRLDATHAIVDTMSPDILRLLSQTVAQLEPPKLLIAEDNRNDCALVNESGLNAVWADDFHHQLRVTMTGEQDGYYAAYKPGVEALARTIEQGWLYQGELFAPTGEPRGCPAEGLEASAFVYCIQNHDQIGNRALGDRLNAAINPELYRAASTLLLFLPMTPMLFMGQEWAASAPFLFFTDHDPELGRLVSEGRREEFKDFEAFKTEEGRRSIPDPQQEETFFRSKLDWSEKDRGEHGRVWKLYARLLELRRTDPVWSDSAAARRGLSARGQGNVLTVRRQAAAGTRVLMMNFGDAPAPIDPWGQGKRVIVRSDGETGALPDSVPPFTAIVVGDSAPLPARS